MITRLKQRLAAEESGFTLIELLVVIIILGILMAIAVPSYLNFQDNANKKAAQANVRAVLPSMIACGQDRNNDFSLCTIGLLQTDYDASISGVTLTGSAGDFSISASSGGWCATKADITAQITVAACP